MYLVSLQLSPMHALRFPGILLCSILSVAAIAQHAPFVDSSATFRIPNSELSSHIKVIAYGDQRFHDPSDAVVANPKAREWLVQKIAQRKPDAIQMSGDVPYRGTDPEDYNYYRTETKPWRDENLHVYPALGNHELAGGVQKGMDDWWDAFPQLKGMRWYSVQLGDRVVLIQLDSTSDLTSGSRQIRWLRAQLTGLAPSVDFVIISLHHPPIADIQTVEHVDHNPRPNELALRDFLAQIDPTLHAAIVVVAGHIHNYERFNYKGITYLVSGGGGAVQYKVTRGKDDLYQGPGFPNFHFVEFDLKKDNLKATMFRLEGADNAKKPKWQKKDHFEIKEKK
jgi:hypothetical protein